MADDTAQNSEVVRDCPLGCGRSGKALGALPSTAACTLSRERYTLAQCGCCELIYLSPAPSADDLRTMYVDQNQFGDEYTDERRVREILAYVTQALERLLVASGRDSHAPLRVLEVGAGLAWMCRAAKARDPRTLTLAQDVSPEAVAICPWVDHYIQDDLGDVRIDAHGPYDVISLTHVIEHLVDPVGAIARCRSLLAPGGLIFITAPHRPRGWNDAAPDLARWIAYSYNHVPAHIQYFSRGSMSRLAQAAGCGLVHWSHEHEGGEAFEAWLGRGRIPLWRRMLGKWRARLVSTRRAASVTWALRAPASSR